MICRYAQLVNCGASGTSLFAAYIDVTAVITNKTTIRGLDISNISLKPNLFYPNQKPFNLFDFDDPCYFKRNKYSVLTA
jgi:hypothetical protein